MKSSAILELLAESRPGQCPLCDERLPLPRTGRSPGARRKYCGAADCKRLYHKLYAQGRPKALVGRRVGERHPTSKLTAEKVRQIRATKNLSFRQLAKAMGVTVTCIGNVVRGISWKHVPGAP